MSESSYGSSGESSYQRKNTSSSSGESSFSSSKSVVEKAIKTKSPKKSISTIKDTLKNIENNTLSHITDNKNKELFTNEFRKIIIENEAEILQFPTVDFFISKFEDSIIPKDVKELFVSSLYTVKYKDKENKSNLKYW